MLLNCSSATTLKKGEGFACECQKTDVNRPANVIWYRNNTKIVKGKAKQFCLSMVLIKMTMETYRCGARTRKKTKNEVSIELIVIRKYTVDAHACSSS